VTVFGVGVAASDTAPTTDPQLVVIASGTNVLGNVTYQLTNPNAYYCIISATSVLGNLNIQVKDKSHLAMVRNSGAGLVTTSVMGNVTVEEVR
jgi:hypothetical protein